MLILFAVLAACLHLAQAQIQCVCVATWEGGALNVRDGPSTGSNIVGVVVPTECMKSTDSCLGGWCEVELPDGAAAYVSADYVSGPQECGHPVEAPAFCFDTHCGATGSNSERGCDAYGCGNNGASRGTRAHAGSDVVCSEGSRLNAPFDGFLWRPVPPYGDGACCDDGYDFQAEGDSDWADGYFVRAFYANGYSVGASTSRGDQMATHIGLSSTCGGAKVQCYPSSMTDHSHVEVWTPAGARIDSTSFLYCNFPQPSLNRAEDLQVFG